MIHRLVDPPCSGNGWDSFPHDIIVLGGMPALFPFDALSPIERRGKVRMKPHRNTRLFSLQKILVTLLFNCRCIPTSNFALNPRHFCKCNSLFAAPHRQNWSCTKNESPQDCVGYEGAVLWLEICEAGQKGFFALGR